MPEDFYDLPPSASPDEVEPGSRDEEIINWCEKRLTIGRDFIQGQVGYDRISQTIDEIFSNERQNSVSYIPTGTPSTSTTKANLVGKIGEDLTGLLTDVRPFWNYTTNNTRYTQQCTLSNKSAEEWYKRHNISQRMADIIRYYTVAGTGIGHLYYSRLLNDFYLDAEDPRNVYPIDPMDYTSFKRCRGAIVVRPRTPDWVREEYGKVVNPDDNGSGFFGWLRRVIDGPGSRGGPLSKRNPKDQVTPGHDVVLVKTLYLKDKRVNRSGKTLRWGPWKDNRPAATWAYECRPGMPLFPFGRLIVWGNRVLMYNDTAPYWHGEIPLLKVTLNPWPWSWFGKAPLWDTLPLQNSITNNLRVIDDHANQVAHPGVVADRNVSKAELNKFNSRKAGYKIKTNLASGKGIQVQIPPQLDPLIWEVVTWCVDMMGKMAGTFDPSAIASLAQMPSDDTIDTLMKAMTPSVRLRSRYLEGAYNELAEMYLYDSLQFDTLSKRVAKFGPEAVTAEDFDYDAGTMIPDDVPDGEPGDIASMESAWAMDNPRPMYSRARAMLASFSMYIDPASLLNTAHIQDLMMYFMLAKMGYVSVFTLMDKAGVKNFAPPTMQVPPDEISRLALQAQLGIGMMANAQGRKATDQSAPSMEVTGNGPTIATS